MIEKPSPLLLPFVPFYAGAVWLRNKAYDTRTLTSEKAALPVISVGNLTVGGTGKTPLVAWLIEYLKKQGRAPAVLARGYRSLLQAAPLPNIMGPANDEILELAGQFPDTLIFSDPDRRRSAHRAKETGKADCLILDDGFQHRALARDLDIVVLNALVPFGNGHLLPAGPLREPVSSLRRAHAILLSHCDLVLESDRARLIQELTAIAPQVPVMETRHGASHLVSLSTRETLPLEYLRGKSIYTFAGIGSPEAFFKTVECLGGKCCGAHAFRDHHLYTEDDIRRLSENAGRAGADFLLATGKDAVKLRREWKKDVPILILRTNLAIRSNESALADEISRRIHFFP